jgi:hypothetical protein
MKFTFYVNTAVGAILFSPVAAIIAKKFKSTSGGVPLVPYQRFVHDFINVEPTAYSRWRFRLFFIGSSLAFGIFFAGYMMKDDSYKKNKWFNRPDLRPYPAMVPKECLDPQDSLVYEAHYQTFRNKKAKEDRKKSTWYRLLFPFSANYETVKNPYVDCIGSNDAYNPKNGFYPSIHNHFRDHEQE